MTLPLPATPTTQFLDDHESREFISWMQARAAYHLKEGNNGMALVLLEGAVLLTGIMAKRPKVDHAG